MTRRPQLATLLLAVLTLGLAAPARASHVRQKWMADTNGPTAGFGATQATAMDTSGNVLVTGCWFRANGTLGGYRTAKYAAATGELVWDTRYSALRYGWTNAIAVDAAGNAIVTGELDDDVYTVKYAAATGAVIWAKRFDAPGPSDDNEDEGEAIIVDGEGNVIVAASVDSSSGSRYIAKYASATGILIWEKYYAGPSVGGTSLSRVMAIDAAGNLILTGSAHSLPGYEAGYDCWTAKFATASGDLIWQRRYQGAVAGGYNSGLTVTTDPASNVIVVAIATAAGGTAEYYTAKYSGATGVPLWEKHTPNVPKWEHYDIVPDGAETNRVVMADGNGDIIVAGSCYGGYTRRNDYYTAKYSGATGATLWETTYGGPANFDDGIRDAALDGQGNVVVTGFSRQSLYEPDCYTAKYHGGSGTLLWERRLENADGYCMARDTLGKVAVAGWVAPDAQNQYFLTALYEPVLLEVEHPAGNPLSADAPSVTWEATAQGSTSTLTLTIHNAGDTALEGVSAQLSGISAGDFNVDDSGMATALAADTRTTLQVSFHPHAAGPKSAVLNLKSTSPNVPSRQITLSGRALAFTEDSDGDGLNDAAEAQLAALGFNWQSAQVPLVAALRENAKYAGLYPLAELQAREPLVPLLARDPATHLFSLAVGCGRSTDLKNFSNQPAGFAGIDNLGKLECRFTDAAPSAFYQLRVGGSVVPGDPPGSPPSLDPTDSDGDGLSNEAETALAAFGFDAAVSQTDLVTTLRRGAAGAGLYTMSDARTLRVDAPALARDAAGIVTLRAPFALSAGSEGYHPFDIPASTVVTITQSGGVEMDFPVAEEIPLLRLEAE